MCSIPTVRLIVMMFSWVKAAFMLYIFGIGCFFASSLDLQHGYGVEYISYGLSLVFLAILSLSMIYPLKYGVDRHNRFLLVMVFVFETIVFAELINFGVTIQSYTIPQFSKSLQLDCLRNNPIVYTTEECDIFYRADRTAGFRLVWQYYFSTKDERKSYQILSTLQESGCCGFFPPFHCKEIESGYPKSLGTTGIDKKFLKQRVSCGAYENYYPEQNNCIDYYDFAASPPIVGGCEYDLGVGFCLTQDVDGATAGCASATEDYVSTFVIPQVPMLIGCSILNLAYMLIACCMWWKRKESDVFPAFLNPPKSKVEYKNVPSEFELLPIPGILVKEKFLPPDYDGNEAKGMDDEESQQANLRASKKPGKGMDGIDEDDEEDDDEEEEEDDDAE